MKEKKVIVTVIGKDKVGIIARTCTYLADSGVNILDISQTIVQGYFNMMMIVDFAQAVKPFADCARELESLVRDMGVKILCQKAEIFESMHQI